MNQRTAEILTLALLALGIVVAVVALILLIFLLTGHQALLSEFLHSTAEGELFGVAFTTGGPFGMWIIAFLLFRFAGKQFSQGAIKLYLRFPEPQVAPPPSRTSEYHNSTCWYSVLSNGQAVGKPKETKIQIDQDIGAPYIYVKATRVENPEFQVRFKYQEQEWLSDSYSPKTGSVDLQ